MSLARKEQSVQLDVGVSRSVNEKHLNMITVQIDRQPKVLQRIRVCCPRAGRPVVELFAARPWECLDEVNHHDCILPRTWS